MLRRNICCRTRSIECLDDFTAPEGSNGILGKPFGSLLREGARLGQRTLHITLSETLEELNDVAASHAWTLEGINFIELNTVSERLEEEANYTLYHRSDTGARYRREILRLKQGPS